MVLLLTATYISANTVYILVNVHKALLDERSIFVTNCYDKHWTVFLMRCILPSARALNKLLFENTPFIINNIADIHTNIDAM